MGDRRRSSGTGGVKRVGEVGDVREGKVSGDGVCGVGDAKEKEGAEVVGR